MQAIGSLRVRLARFPPPRPLPARALSHCRTLCTAGGNAFEQPKDGAPKQPGPEGAKEDLSEAAQRARLLEAALQFVPEKGWTVDALSSGAVGLGLSPAAHGILARGPVELVEHFVSGCDAALAQELEERHAELRELEIQNRLLLAMQSRLQMLEPHVGTWSQVGRQPPPPARRPPRAALPRAALPTGARTHLCATAAGAGAAHPAHQLAGHAAVCARPRLDLPRGVRRGRAVPFGAGLGRPAPEAGGYRGHLRRGRALHADGQVAWLLGHLPVYRARGELAALGGGRGEAAAGLQPRQLADDAPVAPVRRAQTTPRAGGKVGDCRETRRGALFLTGPYRWANQRVEEARGRVVCVR